MRGEEVKNPIQVTAVLLNGVSVAAEMAVLDHGQELRFFYKGTKDEIDGDRVKSWEISGPKTCDKCGQKLRK